MMSLYLFKPLSKFRGMFQYGQKLEIFLIGATLFFAAMYFCFPVPYSPAITLEYPWWAKKTTFKNVQFYELFFLIWSVCFGHRLFRKEFWGARCHIRLSVGVLAILALWCGLASISAPLASLDAGRTLRLLFNAALMCAVFEWSLKNGDRPLFLIIIGFLVGTVINLIISYEFPLVICGVLRMAGQNTPGVAMAVAIHLCAWFFLRTPSPRMRIAVALMLPIFIYGSFFSESKTAWFIAGLGMIGWTYIFFVTGTKNLSVARMLKIIKYAVVLIVVALAINVMHLSNKILGNTASELASSFPGDICATISSIAAPTSIAPTSSSASIANPPVEGEPAVSHGASVSAPLAPTFKPAEWIHTFTRQSLGMLAVKYIGSAQSSSARKAYVIGALEILEKHPFGVGYSGFYNAMVDTDIYKSGRAAEEVSPTEANPHSSFLWYITAGGIPGGLLAVLLFVVLLRNLKQGLVAGLGRPGYLFFTLAALSYLAIGLVVPYIYNSIILIIPTAIAAGWIKKGHGKGA